MSNLTGPSSRRWLCILVALVALGAQGPAAALVACAAPRNPANDRPAKAEATGARPYECKPPPASVRNIRGVNFYTDKRGSEIDPKMLGLAESVEAPIRRFTSALGDMGAALYATQYRSGSVADCILAWTSAWASQDALLGEVDDTGALYRAWATLPIATTLSLLPEGMQDDPRRRQVVRWLSRLAAQNIDLARRRNSKNNIRNWIAASVAYAYVVTGDCDLLRWATDKVREGIRDVDPAGLLPGEVARGRRALSYHTFALTPLAIAAEVVHANADREIFKLNDRGMYRVAARIMEAENSTEFFDKAAGIRQDVKLPLEKGFFIWAEILARHSDDPALKELLRRKRPLKFDRAGGNVTVLCGPPAR